MREMLRSKGEEDALEVGQPRLDIVDGDDENVGMGRRGDE